MPRAGWTAGVGILEHPGHLKARIEAIVGFSRGPSRGIPVLPVLAALSALLLIETSPVPAASEPSPAGRTGLRLDLEFDGLDALLAHPDLPRAQEGLRLP